METIKATIKKVIYYDEKSYYSVLLANDISGWQESNKIVGIFRDAKPGITIVATGEWGIHPQHGYQFAAEVITEELPVTIEGIKSYLASGIVHGIGPKFAKVIVDAFGTKTFDVMSKEPEKLLELPGIGEKKVKRIIDEWRTSDGLRNIMTFLQSYGISVNLAKKIYKEYGDRSADVVKENPYRLATDIWGIGFKKADEIAQRMGYALDDRRRISAGIVYSLDVMTTEGHSCANMDMFLKKAKEVLGNYELIIKQVTGQMVKSGDLYCDREKRNLYLPKMKEAEDDIASAIRKRETHKMNPIEISIEDAEKAAGLKYEKKQIEAIQAAFYSNMTIITGGPGTGKTTIMKAIANGFENEGKVVCLAAPTGKAAKRLSESTGITARTIHRLLEYNPSTNCFDRNIRNPLVGDVLIVDESSMIDLQLFHSLMQATPVTMRVILVGDIDQLPSVGAGNVLSDMIASKCCKTVKLDVPFRQAEESDIIKNAHLVNTGKIPVMDGVNDFLYVESTTQEETQEKIMRLIEHWIPNQYGFKSDDIQVLAPMKKGAAGTRELNERIQSVLNPYGKEIQIGRRVFRVGDHVIQLKNDYKKNVFNGDSGIITSIDEDFEVITVSFDGMEVDYKEEDVDQLTLSYAITIHKSQGSEYPVVIIPILGAHYVMLQRNLLYTGITRGKKLVVLVGDSKSIATAVRNKKASNRNSGLKDKLQIA